MAIALRHRAGFRSPLVAVRMDESEVILNKMPTWSYFCHRPDPFARDDPRGGEADLILGKHRSGPTKTITAAHQLHLSRFANMAK